MSGLDSEWRILIPPVVIVGLIGWYAYSESQTIGDRSLVPGVSTPIDMTVGAYLRKRQDEPRYAVFSATEADDAAGDAQLRFTSGAPLSAVRVTATPGDVRVHNVTRDSYLVPGLLVRLEASVTATASDHRSRDTLMLRLPRLGTVRGAALWEPVVLRIDWRPQYGDTLNVWEYRVFASRESLQHTRLAYQAFAACMALLGIFGPLVIIVSSGREDRSRKRGSRRH